MMTLQILESLDFTRTKISRYLKIKMLFFLQIKNLLITVKGLLYDEKIVTLKVTLKQYEHPCLHPHVCQL